MKQKQILPLVLFAIAWLMGTSTFAWDKPTQVDGVYQIGTASELEWFAELVNNSTAENKHTIENAVLTADIDMTGVSHAPIGANTTFKYEGSFDGQHHVIKNMIINLPDKENVGFFGAVRGNAQIKNITIDASCSITGKNRVGGLIGCLQTSATPNIQILNCVNMANVHATAGVASGMIGAGQSVYARFVMHNCANLGNITTDAEENYTVAFNGWNKASGSTSQVWCCYNAGTLSKIDGVNNIFRGDNRSVLNTYDVVNTTYDVVNTTSKYQSQSNIAEPFTTADPLHSGELCYFLNNGIAMQNRNEISLGEEWTQDLSDPNSVPMPNANGKKVYKVAEFYCSGNPKGSVTYSNTDDGSRDEHVFNKNHICTVCGAFEEPALVDGYYMLANAANVEWFSNQVNNAHKISAKAKLTADIDFTDVEHTPIGNSETYKFNGEFDGQGHRILNLTYNDIEKEKVGFFGWLRGKISDDEVSTTIKNLIIDKTCSFTGKNKVGALVGTVQVPAGASAEQTAIIVENVVNEANVVSNNADAGGIFGGEDGGNAKYTIRNVVNTGNITSTGSAGALCCMLRVYGGSLIENFVNLGTITKTNEDKYNIGRYFGCEEKNIIDLSNSVGNQGKVQSLVAADVASGKLAYYLNSNDDQASDAFFQTLGEDEYPLPFATSKAVSAGKWFNDANNDVYYNQEGDNYTVYQLNLNEANTKYDVPANVTAKNVKMTRNIGTGKWNTFVSPVAIDKSVFSDVKELTDVTVNGDNYSMTFTTADEIVPGKPYMVKVSDAVSELTATDVDLAAVSPVTYNGLTFHGVYTNGLAPRESFIISNNMFYLVDSDVTVKAFRGYITTGSQAQVLTFTFDEDETAITEMEDGTLKVEGRIYNLAGQQLPQMQKGVNIINGKKVLK